MICAKNNEKLAGRIVPSIIAKFGHVACLGLLGLSGYYFLKLLKAKVSDYFGRDTLEKMAAILLAGQVRSITSSSRYFVLNTMLTMTAERLVKKPLFSFTPGLNKNRLTKRIQEP